MHDDNEIVIMHEGASGGKSEMNEYIHKKMDGRVLFDKNLATNEKLYLELKETYELKPVTDDMALCHPSLQNVSIKRYS